MFLFQLEHNNHHLPNVTMAHEQAKYLVVRVCLVQLPCNGHLDFPSGGLTLQPEPELCRVDPGKITKFQLSGILQEMFHHMEKQFTLVPAPQKDFMKSEIFKAVKMTINHLPDKNIDAEKALLLAEPFVQHQKCNVRTTTRSLCNAG